MSEIIVPKKYPAKVVVSVSPTPPTGVVTNPYGYYFNASGGSPPFNWAVTSGALPDGLTLASDGTLSGTPTAAGSFAFTVRATDSATRWRPVRSDIEQIQDASERAKMLIRHMLAFARRESPQAEDVDLGQVLNDASLLLGGLLGEHKGINLPGVVLPSAGLTPKDVGARARMNQWISAVNAYYYPYMIYHVTHERVVFPELGIASDEKVVSHALPKIELALGVMERELSRGQDYLLGSEHGSCGYDRRSVTDGQASCDGHHADRDVEPNEDFQGHDDVPLANQRGHSTFCFVHYFPWNRSWSLRGSGSLCYERLSCSSVASTSLQESKRHDSPSISTPVRSFVRCSSVSSPIVRTAYSRSTS
jgi:hypothetical protein